MVIDSHLHLMKKANFNVEVNHRLGMEVPGDTPLDELVAWLKQAGVSKAVVMGQDMSRIWKTTFGEDYVLEAYRQYPDYLVPLASVEPLDEAGKFNREAYHYLERAFSDYGFRGVLLTPPYGHYHSNDRQVYPFYELAQDRGAVVQYHHSAQKGPAILAPTKYTSLFDLNDVMIDFPEMKIVVEHLGYPWSEHLFALMTSDKNLWADLAMTYWRPHWLAWNLILAKEYGVLDRIMYASDYVAFGFDPVSPKPVDDFLSYLEVVSRGINEVCKKSGWPVFTDKEIDGLLWKNAARLYDISL